MVKILKFFAYSLFFLMMLLYFMPKQNLLFLLQEKLQPYALTITQEQLDEKALSLELHNVDLSYEGVAVANIKDIVLQPLIASNSITATAITLAPFLRSYLPPDIASVRLSHQLLDPLHLSIEVKGDFGEAEGSYDLSSKRIVLILHPSKTFLRRYRKSLRYLKKNKEGGYFYEQTLS